MKAKSLILGLASAFFSLTFLGQTGPQVSDLLSSLESMPTTQSQEKCSFDKIMRETLVKDPAFMRSFFRVQQKMAQSQQNDQITIPTIVHILHNGEPYGSGSHINSETVYEVIAGLNEFLDGEESTESPNTLIDICLAQIGPDGNPINAVQYHNVYDIYPNWTGGDPTSNGAYGQIENAIGIEPNEYLNIVVGDWTGNPQGFSALPPADIFVWTKTIQFTNLSSNTLVHEVGHWCGLYHTFQDSPFSPGGYDSCEEAAAEVSCTIEGDRVCDTPPTVLNFGCYEACPGDVIESYMSYASDECQTLFTQGQIDRMHFMMANYRSDVVDNYQACAGTDVSDLGIIGWNDQNPECNTLIYPQAVIKNFGLGGVYAFDLTMVIIDESGEWLEVQTLNLNEEFSDDEVKVFDFEPVLLQYGEYQMEFIHNLVEDEFTGNDQFIETLSLETFTEINVEYWGGFFPTVQWRLYEPNPDLPNTYGDLIASCNWGGEQCFDNTYMPPSEWPIEWSWCLPPGCYQLWWRWTSNANLECMESAGYENCFVDITLSDGQQLYYADSPIDSSQTLYIDFCVSELDPCPITECPWDLDGDGAVTNLDLLVFLQYVGTEDYCAPTDFNFDGITDINDLSLFLNNYGYDCQTGEIIESSGMIPLNLFKSNEAEIIETKYYDLLGRNIDEFGLKPGQLYIVIEKYDDGTWKQDKKYFFE